MSKENRKATNEDFINITDENASKTLVDQMKKINGLPDDCFTSLAQDDEVTVPISGRFLGVLRQQMAYLLESEESYTCLTALTRIKENFRDKNNNPVPNITLFEQALWANMTMISGISAAAVQQQKATVYDKNQFFHSVDQCMKNGTGDPDELQPLDEAELASRMGMTVDADGNLHLDKDYLKKTGKDAHNWGNSEVDIAMKRKFSETSESIKANPDVLDGSKSAKGQSTRKENIRAEKKRKEDLD